MAIHFAISNIKTERQCQMKMFAVIEQFCPPKLNDIIVTGKLVWIYVGMLAWCIVKLAEYTWQWIFFMAIPLIKSEIY
jgi:hypothetical protein